MSFLLAALLIPLSTVAVAPTLEAPDLNAIRHIACDEGNGSGFLIGDDILVTAEHVASLTNCKDGATGVPLNTYYSDESKDFAIMTGDLPDVRYLRYNCKPFYMGHNYSSYGYSSYQMPKREFLIKPHTVTGLYGPVLGVDRMAALRGYARPGNSGGPMILTGTNIVTGMVNAGNLHIITGEVLGTTFSVELRDTVLCG